MKVLNSYSKLLNGLIRVFRVIFIVFMAAIVLILFFQSVMRYVFNDPQPWCEELALYLSIAVIMCGLGIATRHAEHLQVDVIVRLFSDKTRCLVTAFWSVVSIVIMLVFLVYSIKLMGISNAVSITMPFLKVKHVYAMFPLGAVMMILFTIESFFRNIIGFKNNGVLPAIPGEEEGGEE